METTIKKWATLLLGIFFIVAGINHFVMPGFYYPLIPDYIPFPVLVNYSSGLMEIMLGMGALTKRYRSYASKGILILLLLFIPSHVHFIMIGSCVEEGLCVHPAIGWLRLVIIHPLLMAWAWWVGKGQ